MRDSIWRLLDYIKPYKKQILIGFICIVFMNVFSLSIPWALGDAIDDILLSGEYAVLGVFVLIIMVLIILKGIFYFGQKYLMTYVIQRVVVDLREEMYTNLQRLSLSFHEKTKVGETLSRLTNDIGVIREILVLGITDMVANVAMITGILGLIFYLNLRLALITCITVPLASYAMKYFGDRMRKVSRRVQERAADVISVMQEALSAIRIIKAFTSEDREIEKFSKVNQETFNAEMKSAGIQATLPPLVEFIASLGLIAILWYGGREVISGGLSMGEFMKFLIYVGLATKPINGLSVTSNILHKCAASSERIFEIIDADEKIYMPVNAKKMPRIMGEVVFSDVYFSYSSIFEEPIEEMALNKVSFKVMPGEVIALAGPSGAGKTTIGNLIGRFYDPVKGGVFVDGYNLKEMDIRSYREQLGIVPQETILFSGTISYNIAYGRRNASEEEIVEAAKAANAHDFITSLPQGYKTLVGERGANLSGGQKQRIAIARALLRDPRILILDEATSALDAESEELVQKALNHLMRGRTTFIIAHRFSTIKMADRILVLDKGRLVETGEHLDLLRGDGVYRRMHNIQAGGI